jgi:hypothetical protein
MPARMIFKGRGTSSRELQALLQTVFVCEVLEPSETFWIVSPWVTDIEVVDNTAGGFSGVAPDWGRRPILLTEVLSRMIAAGTRITLATRDVAWNEPFRARLTATAEEIGAEDQLHIVWDEEERLHEKGILGDGYCIIGSMNVTESGVRLNDEQVRYSTDEEDVAEQRIHFTRRYGP